VRALEAIGRNLVECAAGAAVAAVVLAWCGLALFVDVAGAPTGPFAMVVAGDTRTQVLGAAVTAAIAGPPDAGTPDTAAPAPVPLGVDLTAGVATYAYGPDPHQLLDVRVPPPSGETARPTLLYLHSGGWVAGSRVNLADFVERQLARGWNVVSIDYALAPAATFPAPNGDVDRAIRWVRANAAALGVDADRMVLVGTSAGGNLAVLAAGGADHLTDPELPAALAGVSAEVAAVVAVAAPTDMAWLLATGDRWGLVAGRTYLGCVEGAPCDPAVLQAANPAHHVDADPPPALLMFGELDTLVPAAANGRPLADAWSAAGGWVRVDVEPGVGHNLNLVEGFDLDLFEAFLDRFGRWAPVPVS